MDFCKHDSSGQVCSTELLDITIEDARINKKILVSMMDSVTSLIKEVECKEKAAEQAKEEAARSSLDILAKIEELEQARRRVKETNDMFARQVYAQKAVLATEMKELQLRVSSSFNEGERSLGVLVEMRRTLEKRLNSALIKKEAADKEKIEKEVSSREELAYEESQWEKEVEESKKLKQEALENAKLQEFLIDRGHVVDTLHGEISDKRRDVNLLKQEIDQAILLNENVVTEIFSRPRRKMLRLRRIKRRIAGSKEKTMLNNRNKSLTKNAKKKVLKFRISSRPRRKMLQLKKIKRRIAASKEEMMLKTGKTTKNLKKKAMKLQISSSPIREILRLKGIKRKIAGSKEEMTTNKRKSHGRRRMKVMN